MSTAPVLQALAGAFGGDSEAGRCESPPMAKRTTKTSSPPGHGKDETESVAGFPATDSAVQTAADGNRWKGPAVLRPLLVQIERLRPDPKNARSHDERSYEAIRTSLRKFGQRKVIVVDSDAVVVAGNGTLEAARREGWTHLAVADTADMSPEDVRAFALADNRTAELSEWDFGALQKEVGELGPEALSGFYFEEMESILTGASRLEDALLALPSGERSTMATMTFSVTPEQRAVILDAIAAANRDTRTDGIIDGADGTSGNRNAAGLERLAISYLRSGT